MLRKQKKKSSDPVCAAYARKIRIAVLSLIRLTLMDFLRSGFRQQTGNLRVDTFPGPILDNDTDRIKRISNYLILLFRVN